MTRILLVSILLPFAIFFFVIAVRKFIKIIKDPNYSGSDRDHDHGFDVTHHDPEQNRTGHGHRHHH